MRQQLKGSGCGHPVHINRRINFYFKCLLMISKAIARFEQNGMCPDLLIGRCPGDQAAVRID